MCELRCVNCRLSWSGEDAGGLEVRVGALPMLLHGVLPGAWPTQCVLEIQNRVEHESVRFIRVLVKLPFTCSTLGKLRGNLSVGRTAWHPNILQFSSTALCSLNLQFCPFTVNKGDPATGLASWLLLRSCPYHKYDEQMENLCVCHTSKEVN